MKKKQMKRTTKKKVTGKARCINSLDINRPLEPMAELNGDKTPLRRFIAEDNEKKKETSERGVTSQERNIQSLMDQISELRNGYDVVATQSRLERAEARNVEDAKMIERLLRIIEAASGIPVAVAG